MADQSTTGSRRIVIVGGVAGGASTAARLRRLDEKCEIIMLERGPYVSFANCGLPYYVGGVIEDRDALELMNPELFNERFNFDVRVKHEVIRIDRENKQIIVNDIDKESEYTLSYDKLVLSPGASPFVPPITGLDQVPYFTVRNIPDVENIVKYINFHKATHAVVIGGGYIGVEMAENLRERGMEVEIVEMLPQVMAPIDYEMAQIVHQELGFNGIKLHLEEKAVGFNKPADKVEIELESGKIIKTDLLIMAVGVKPDTKLALDSALEITNRGHIIVNEYMQTSDPDIYAVGDAIQVHNLVLNEPWAVPLAGIANRQGRVAADNLAGVTTHCEGVIGTSVLKVFDLTVAATGMNERTLKTKDIKYEKVYAHPNNHAGYYPGAASLAMKLLFEVPTGKILGLQVVGGQGAEKRVDVVATAMKFNGTVFDLERLELAYAPPFGSAKDPVNMLGFIASNVLRGTMKIYHWHDLDEISDKNGFFLDVRTKEEFDLAHFEGAVNFSDLELRDHLDELPRNRPIYVNCQVGFRGYLSYRMLVQSGFTEVYNLTGGYKTYEYATMSREEFEPMSVNPKVKILEQSIGRPADDISGQKTIKTIDACGLSCPGPLSALVEGLRDLPKEQFLEIRATDPGFASSVKAYAELNEGVDLISLKKKGGVLTTTMYKTKDYQEPDERMKDIREDLEETPVRPVGLPVVSEITAQDLYNEMIGPNPPAIVIDVREKNEWKRGHIKGSTLIPLGEFQQRIPELEKYKKQEVIVLCQAGSRSYMAGRFLERSGFEYIRNLRGGIVSWVRSGFDYVR